ncbi:unnamed protein product [Paramecium pentaurelia]|uniref:Uncharacterized protein n=1 Tax=Paramecium pentaurelia TaxID=43138 RepID=A0A8S1X428_9CILI|nr:unnamed protein product [Paramecium pentaurelia]
MKQIKELKDLIRKAKLNTVMSSKFSCINFYKINYEKSILLQTSPSYSNKVLKNEMMLINLFIYNQFQYINPAQIIQKQRFNYKLQQN